ncbi:hypothetical protein Ciccas_011984 [Cichlidogyrus casuarinus]|uniref:Uncharacterized protein n=1 Tax=Cichlidogyrus casuarinus TaxID=1844966 RepID=A0ABD2PPP6_9PLAT
MQTILNVDINAFEAIFPNAEYKTDWSDSKILLGIFSCVENLEEILTTHNRCMKFEEELTQCLSRALAEWKKSLKRSDFEAFILLICLLLFYSDLTREIQLGILREILEKLCSFLIKKKFMGTDLVVQSLLLSKAILQTISKDGDAAAKQLLVSMIQDETWGKCETPNKNLEQEIRTVCFLIVLVDILWVHENFFVNQSIELEIDPENCFFYLKDVEEEMDEIKSTKCEQTTRYLQGTYLESGQKHKIFFMADNSRIGRLNCQKKITNQQLIRDFRNWKSQWCQLKEFQRLVLTVTELTYSEKMTRNEKLSKLQKIIRLLSKWLDREEKGKFKIHIQQSIHNARQMLRFGSDGNQKEADKVFLLAVDYHRDEWIRRDNPDKITENAGSYNIPMLFKHAIQDMKYGLNGKALFKFIVYQLGNFIMFWAMLYSFEVVVSIEAGNGLIEENPPESGMNEEYCSH